MWDSFEHTSTIKTSSTYTEYCHLRACAMQNSAACSYFKASLSNNFSNWKQAVSYQMFTVHTSNCRTPLRKEQLLYPGPVKAKNLCSFSDMEQNHALLTTHRSGNTQLAFIIRLKALLRALLKFRRWKLCYVQFYLYKNALNTHAKRQTGSLS